MNTILKFLLLFGLLGEGLGPLYGRLLGANSGLPEQRIAESTAFYPRLVATMNPVPGNAAAVELAGLLAETERDPDLQRMLSRLDGYLQRHPESPWFAALSLALGDRCRDSGAYTRALRYWRAGYESTRDAQDPASVEICGGNLARLAHLLASLGRRSDLIQLRDENMRRQIPREADLEVFHRAVLGIDTMRHAPERSYRCGSFALMNAAQSLPNGSLFHNVGDLIYTDSPKGGFSLTELAGLSEQRGLPFIPVKWTLGQPVVVPSIVHWRQRHYAAITEKRGNHYFVVDPTFGQGRWIPEWVIHEEATGYFLIPSDRLGTEWVEVEAAEGESIRGMGENNLPPKLPEEPPCSDEGQKNPEDPCEKNEDKGSPCNQKSTGEEDGGEGNTNPDDPFAADGGCVDCDDDNVAMPRWRVTEPYISLWIHDTPMYYNVPRQGRFAFRLAFNKSEGSSVQVNAPEVTSFGKNWNSSWLSYMEVTTLDTFSTYTANLFGPNGGGRVYTQANSTNADFRGRTTLTTIGSGGGTTGFTVNYITGASAKYEIKQTLVSGQKYRAFMTARVSREGLTNMTFRYSAIGTNMLLTQVLDELGRTNKVSYYTNSGMLTLVKEVEDPWGRKTTLGYDGNQQLTGITDVAQIASSFAYTTYTNGANTTKVLTSMTTPYGTTTFHPRDPFSPAFTDPSYSIVNGINRALLVTKPNGAKYLFMYRDNSATIVVNGVTTSYISATPSNVPDSPCPRFLNANMNYRNSFTWGPRQYAALSTTNITNFSVNDYRLGRLRNWLHENGTASLSTTLNMQQGFAPSVGVAGPQDWFGYQGKPAGGDYCGQDPFFEGGWQIPGMMARRILTDSGFVTNFVQREFNSRGNVTKVVRSFTKPDGTIGTRTNSYTYSSDGLDNLRHIDVTGLTNVWTYDSNHRPLTLTDPFGQTRKWAYTAAGLLAGTEQPTGLVTSNLYDGSGFLSKTYAFEIVGGTPKNYWSNSITLEKGNVITVKDVRGLVQSNSWDALNRLTNITYYPGGTVSITYGDATRPLNISRIRDQLGNTNYFGWDSNRKLVAVTNALGHFATFNYCSCGALESITDFEGKTTEFGYTLRGLRNSITFPGGAWVTNYYDLENRITSQTNSFGYKRYFTFNLQGNLQLITSPGILELFARYDLYDRPTNIVDANSVVERPVYDQIGRLKSVLHPDGGFEIYEYNARGLLRYVDSLNKTNAFVRDALGRVTSATNPLSELTQYEYSQAGDLRILTDGRNRKTYWGYDEYGRVTSKTNHLNARLLAYQYNVKGHLTNRWSAAKGNTTSVFNEEGRITAITAQVSPARSFTWDKNGRLKTMTDQFGTSTYAYTDWGALESEDGPWANDKVWYGYNSGLLRSQLSIEQPAGANWSQTYAYDSSMRLDSITSPDGVFNYTPDTLRERLFASISLPNGGFIERQYDTNGWMNLTRLKNSGGTLLDSHAYIFDVQGQPTRRTRHGGDFIDYGYDGSGQLLTALAKESGGSVNRLNESFGYAYDAGGNLLRRTNSVGASSPLIQTFGVNDENELSSITRSGTLTVAGTSSSTATSVTVAVNGGSAVTATRYADTTFAREGISLINGNNTFVAIGTDAYGRSSSDTVTVSLPSTVSYTYDDNGNLTGDGRRIFGYDDDNQLTSVQVSGVWRSEFAYDGLSRRRLRREYTWNGVSWQITSEVRYIYDRSLVVEERDSGNLPLVRYTRGLDLSYTLQGAGGIGGLLCRSDTDGPLYYHSDLGGNVTALMNKSQAVSARYMYDAFGSQILQSGDDSAKNVYRFSSKEWHLPSGLSYYLYRLYDPNLQRWINRDPLGERFDVNMFKFCYNSPVGCVDFNGLWGVQFGDVNIGQGDPWLAFDADSWGDLGRGAAATADGVIPFGNPFEGNYDPCDPVFEASKALGELGRDAALMAAVPNLGTWAENPLLYEIGQKTRLLADFQKFADLSAIERGRAIIGEVGLGRALLPEGAGWGLGIGKTFLTGPTPGGWIGVGGGLEIVDNIWFW